MDANPILAEMTRGNWVENRHRGAFVVCDAGGRVIASAGDIDRAVFPRSAIKSMQAIAMVTSGAIEKLDLSDRELALACASHLGEDIHVEGVKAFLGHLGLDIADLECGAHAPSYAPARDTLRTDIPADSGGFMSVGDRRSSIRRRLMSFQRSS